MVWPGVASYAPRFTADTAPPVVPRAAGRVQGQRLYDFEKQPFITQITQVPKRTHLDHKQPASGYEHGLARLEANKLQAINSDDVSREDRRTAATIT
jgi:hypothetical protein